MRSYAATLGRWLTPDPAGLAAVDPNNPQSWNRYAYVLNNPVALADPFGLTDDEPHRCETSAGGLACPITNLPINAGIPSTDNGFDPTGVYFGPNNSPGGGGFVGPTIPNADVQKSFTRLFQCGLDSGELMAAVEQSFANFGNYDGSGPLGSSAFADFSPGALFAGETLDITSQMSWASGGHTVSVPGASYNVSVRVDSVGQNSFTFQAQPGHVLFPAFITFAAANVSPSEVRFSVNVSAKFASVWDRLLFDFAGGSDLETNIWNHLMDDVQGMCK